MINEELSDKEHSVKNPALYSKNAIYIFSILFNTIFGAALLIRNFIIADKKEGIRPVLFFTAFHMLFLIILLAIIPGNMFLTLIMNILGGFILYEHFWKKYLGEEEQFESKKLWKPLLIAFAVTLPFLILLMYSQGI